MKLEFSAGGIVYRKKSGKYKMLLIRDPFDRWAFPKGHFKKGEKPEEAALREVSEETGLKVDDLKIVSDLGKTDFWFRYKKDLIHKTVYWFLMEAFSDKVRPQKKEKISEVKWVNIDNVLKESAYKDMEPVLKKAISRLRRKIG